VSPLAAVGAALEGKKSIAMLLIIFPVAIIVLIRTIEIVALSIFRSPFPSPFIDSLTCGYINKNSLTMLFTFHKSSPIGEILGLEIIFPLTRIFSLLNTSIIDVSIRQIYSYCSCSIS
jgi:hypothetical protein